MGQLIKRLEKMFAAAAFAEAGEEREARALAGIGGPKPRPAGLQWDRVFAAVTFAEAGCREEALGLLDSKEREPRTLAGFLDTVGLGNVRVCYGLAEI